MSSLKTRAKRLLIEIEAIKEGDFKNRNSDLLALINEALKDAYLLAEEIVGDEWDDEEAA